MKRLCCAFIFFMAMYAIQHAQQDPVFSQYMFNKMSFNPGFAGISNMVCIGLDTRQQWVGIDGAPQSTVFHANTPFRPFGIPGGIGINLLSDNIGFDKDLAIAIAYAYHIPIGEGKLGIGFNAGLLNKALNGAQWKPPVQTEGDNAIPKDGESAFGFDMGLGTFYETDNLFAGFSVKHLVSSKMNFDQASTQARMHYYLMAGYKMHLPNPAIEIQPSALVASDTKNSQVTFNTNIVYNQKFWGGIAYRLGDAVIGMLGLEIFNGIRVTYSYDFSMTDLRKYNSGSHEFSVAYCFRMKVEKTPQKFKSVRFL